MEDSRLLGPVLKRWFASNEWPQSVSEGMARAKGWVAGPWASQISICMSGRLQPKPPFFEALGMFNEAVATRDFVGITDRRLMDRLKRSEPICHDNGVPWNAMDFFGCYIGAIEPPKSLVQPIKQELTEEDVEHWRQGLIFAFRELVLASMDPGGPPAVWKKLEQRCIANGLSPEDVEYTQEVISGFTMPTLDEAKRFAYRYPQRPLIKALMEEKEAVGANVDKLNSLYKWRATLPTAKPEPPVVL